MNFVAVKKSAWSEGKINPRQATSLPENTGNFQPAFQALASGKSTSSWQSERSVVSFLWPGDVPVPGDHPWWTCVSGSRDRLHACDLMAEMFSSLSFLILN